MPQQPRYMVRVHMRLKNVLMKVRVRDEAESRSTISTRINETPPCISSARRYVRTTLSVKQLPENHVAPPFVTLSYQQKRLPHPIAEHLARRIHGLNQDPQEMFLRFTSEEHPPR